MEWMNYHHLLYFWTVAREGGVSRAAKTLRLSQPTVSGQIRALEDTIGQRLFERVGRRLVLSEVGRMVYAYADEIFTVGRELQEALKGRPSGRPMRFVVGVGNVVPKLVAYRLLEPALQIAEPLQLVCHEDDADRLLARLATHELDIVIADAPANPLVNVRVFNHLLGECGVSFFATPRRARALRRGFPRSLDGVPFLMPATGTSLRRALDQWLEASGARPRLVGQFDDSALMKAFGEADVGVFVAPSVIEREVCRQHRVAVFGRVTEPWERFYAISAERRLKHPAVVAVSEAARRELFAARTAKPDHRKSR